LIDEYYELKNKVPLTKHVKSSRSAKKQIKKEITEENNIDGDSDSELVYKKVMKNASDRTNKYMNSH
jgi:hypothetical protein